MEDKLQGKTKAEMEEVELIKCSYLGGTLTDKVSGEDEVKRRIALTCRINGGREVVNCKKYKITKFRGRT